MNSLSNIFPHNYVYLKNKYKQTLLKKKYELLMRKEPVMSDAWVFEVSPEDDSKVRSLYKDSPAHTIMIGFKLHTSLGECGY